MEIVIFVDGMEVVGRRIGGTVVEKISAVAGVHRVVGRRRAGTGVGKDELAAIYIIVSAGRLQILDGVRAHNGIAPTRREKCRARWRW